MTQSETTSGAGGGETVRLVDCPVGLFVNRYGGLCLKTEYGNNEGRIDAYIVESGEFFWGDPPQTITSQRAELVRPVHLDRVSAALAALTAKGGTDVPAGWKLVPIEPTKAMKEAAFGPIMEGGRGGPITADRIRQEAALSTYAKIIAASPPPPAGAAGGGSGDLGALSVGATPGTLSVSGSRRRYDEPSCVIVDASSCRALFALATGERGKDTLQSLADAKFLVGLWNAYRSGRLIEASQGEPAADADPLGQGRIKVPFAWCCSMDPATCDCVTPDHSHAWIKAPTPDLGAQGEPVALTSLSKRVASHLFDLADGTRPLTGWVTIRMPVEEARALATAPTPPAGGGETQDDQSAREIHRHAVEAVYSVIDRAMWEEDWSTAHPGHIALRQLKTLALQVLTPPSGVETIRQDITSGGL